MAIALSALDSGRLGIAAAATGLAQAALDLAVGVRQGARSSSGGRSRDFQGLAFLLADMEAAVTARPRDLPARRPAARRRPAVLARRPPSPSWSAPTTAMRVTTDAVQVLGGAGYTQDFPARALHARGQGDPDLRGHQPDPAAGHQPPRSAEERLKDTPCRSTTSTVALVTGGALRPRRRHRPPAAADGAAVVIVDLPVLAGRGARRGARRARAASRRPTSATRPRCRPRRRGHASSASCGSSSTAPASARPAGSSASAARCRSRTSRTSSTSTSSAPSTCCASRPRRCSTTSRSTATAASSS